MVMPAHVSCWFWACRKERGLQALLPLPSRDGRTTHPHQNGHPRPTPPQDPADKSFILADDALKALTGEERFKGFGWSKLIKQHFL